MTEPTIGVIAVAYLGAGAFYAGADIASDARSKQAFFGAKGALAVAALACIWAPAAAANFARITRAHGWRPALAFFGNFVAPALAIFVPALFFAAAITR